jgi:arsenate reductase (thioredoxin)
MTDAATHGPRAVAARLRHEFGGIYSPETIDAAVQDSYDKVAKGVRVTMYLDLFTERFACKWLQGCAKLEGRMAVDIREVLFVCVHNAGGSRMAAGLLNHRAGGSVKVRSAGSQPASSLSPAVVEAMAEIGVDITQEFPKPLTDDVVRTADAVITIACSDACPIYPAKIYRDWELTDPAGNSLADVREIRDDIDRRVQDLMRELTREPTEVPC